MAPAELKFSSGIYFSFCVSLLGVKTLRLAHYNFFKLSISLLGPGLFTSDAPSPAPLNSSKDTISRMADTSDKTLTQYLLILFDHVTAASWNWFQGTSINCSLTVSGQTVHTHLTWALWFFIFAVTLTALRVCALCVSIRHLRALISSGMMISGIFKAISSISIPGDFQKLAEEGSDQSDLSLNLSWLRQEDYTRDL